MALSGSRLKENTGIAKLSVWYQDSLFSYPALDPDPSVKKQKCFDKFWIYAVVRLQNNFLS